MIYDPFINDSDVFLNNNFVDLNDGLKEADIISLHASGSNVILGSEQFKKMKDKVIILNSSRAGLIDQDAFIKITKSRQILRSKS